MVISCTFSYPFCAWMIDVGCFTGKYPLGIGFKIGKRSAQKLHALKNHFHAMAIHMVSCSFIGVDVQHENVHESHSTSEQMVFDTRVNLAMEYFSLSLNIP